MGVYKSIYQIKQQLIMNINFAVYFGIITVLNCFGDDQCLGHCLGDDQKLVSDEANQVFPLLF